MPQIAMLIARSLRIAVPAVTAQRIYVWLLTIVLCLSSAASAQQQPNSRQSGQNNPAHAVNSWDLGHGLGGVSSVGGVSDSGIVVMNATKLSDQKLHLYAVRLMGPNGPQWSDLGKIGMNGEWLGWPWISENGLISDNAEAAETDPATGSHYRHAFLFRGDSDRIDLGTLADIGYDSYKVSCALWMNRNGTIISGCGEDPVALTWLPVVWTRSVEWRMTSGLTAVWKIHKLETPDGFPYGQAMGANNLGQIPGFAYNDHASIPILWNPRPGGSGWDVVRLPPAFPDNPGDYPQQINEKGEIVGLAWDWNGHGTAGLWRPLDPQRRIYESIKLPHIGATTAVDQADSISDSGDIVGGILDVDGNLKAVRWSARDTDFVERLGFPGFTSLAGSVNNKGIAAGSYSDNALCQGGCAYAVQFRRDQDHR